MTIAKRLIAVALTVMMIFSVMAIGVSTASAAATIDCDTLYLQPAKWQAENARFVGYFFDGNGNDAWVDAVERTDDATTYDISVPDGNWTNVIFCRMDGSTTENNWDNKWNQTGNLTYDGTNNLFTITDWSEGVWSTYVEKIVYFVNTDNWSTVYGYGTTDNFGGTTAWPGKAATVVDAENGVYSFNPGDRKKVCFNDGNVNTSFFVCADVYGKYIEPKTNTYYNTVEEAMKAAGVEAETTAPTVAPTEAPAVSEFAGKTYYLVPNEWKKDGARFVAYFFKYGYSGEWIDMTDADGDGIYEAVCPEGSYYNQVVFYRMSGLQKENIEANVWNKSNQTFLEYGNCYTITLPWSDYDPGDWSNYTPVENVVYFVNTDNWTDVYGFGWTDGIGSDTAWPGKAATVVDAANGVYSYNPGNRKEVLFNNGEVNTSYFTCTDVYGKYIEPKTNTYYETLEDALEAAKSVESADGNSYYLSGSFNSWSETSNPLYVTDGSATTSMTLAAGVYEFKVVDNGTWYGSNTTINDKASGVALASNAGNIELVANGGTYVFTYSISDKTLTISSSTSSDSDVTTPAENVVYFVNTDNWSTVYGFGWTDGIGSNTAWPGTAATVVDAEKGVYSYDPGNRKEVLFNNNEVNTSYFTCSEVYGKYIEPKTNKYYNTVEEALAAANAVEPSEKTNYYLSGSFNSWSATAKPLYVTDGIATASMTLESGVYEFKIVDNGNWYGCDVTISNKTSVSGITVDATSGNIKLAASGGTYTFAYAISTQTLVITYTAGSQGGYDTDGTEATKPSDSEIIATEPTDKDDVCEEHNYGKATTVKKATYFNKGKKVYTCADCGATKTVKTAKLKLAKPTVKVTKGAKAITVNCTKKVKGATGFEVKYTIKGKSVTKTFAAKNASTTINKLGKGSYKVQVRAFVKQGKKVEYSKWTTAKKVKVK